ncbi:MAG: hypothetical protein ACR2JC_08330 [Chloroflexota bacterium]
MDTAINQRAVRTPATSFIVRVWESDGSGNDMRGEIEHIGTGQRRFFDSRRGLLHQIEAWRGELDGDPAVNELEP